MKNKGVSQEITWKVVNEHPLPWVEPQLSEKRAGQGRIVSFLVSVGLPEAVEVE